MCLAAGSIWGLSAAPLVWDKSTKTPAVHSCLDKSRHGSEGEAVGVNRVSEVKLDTRNRRIYGVLQMDIVENPTANTVIIQPDTRLSHG